MMSLSRICRWTGGVLHGPDGLIRAVSTDTRTIEPGSLFVALRGERFDGHQFLAEARAAGAVAALVEQYSGDGQIVVPDTRQALGRLAAGYAAQFRVPRVAVTGNAGKTTVKEMIAALLGEGTLSTQGNLNNDIGVPQTLLRFDKHCRQAVIELGASAPGEIAWTSSLVRPNVALITNVTGAHLEGFGSMDGIARAKAEIFTGCPQGGVAIINNDDDYADFFADAARQQKLSILRVGTRQTEECSFYTEEMLLSEHGASFLLMPYRLPVTVPLVGVHQVSNVLMAIAAVSALGFELDQVLPRLLKLRPVPGRMNVMACAGGTLIDDTYNANPGSVRAAIRWLADRPAPRTLVLGALAELGAGGEALMQELGREAREAGLEKLIALPGAEAAARGFGGAAEQVADHAQAAARAATLLAGGGTVLVKGSRSARMEQVVQQLTTNEGRGR